MHACFNTIRKLTLCLIGLCVISSTFGCASRFEQTLEQTLTASEAVTRFGNPTSTRVLDNGHTRREWILDESEEIPGRYVTRWQWMGHDEDGYPVEYPYVQYIPPHTAYYRCMLVIVADPAGVILEKRFRGNACDALPFVNVERTDAEDAPPAAAEDKRTGKKKKNERVRGK